MRGREGATRYRDGAPARCEARCGSDRFCGADVEATERARGYFTGYPPSSPAVALLRGGKIIHMMERHQIENQEAQSIAADLTAAFDTHCATEAVS